MTPSPDKPDDRAENEPNEIWLQPACTAEDDDQGRCWCRDDPGPCEGCGLPSVRYVLAARPAPRPPAREVEEIRPWSELLEPIVQKLDLAATFDDTKACWDKDGARALAAFLREMARDNKVAALAERDRAGAENEYWYSIHQHGDSLAVSPGWSTREKAEATGRAKAGKVLGVVSSMWFAPSLSDRTGAEGWQTIDTAPKELSHDHHTPTRGDATCENVTT